MFPAWSAWVRSLLTRSLLVLTSVANWDSLRQVLAILRGLARSRTELLAENALLRQQLIALRRQVERPRLTPGDRWWMVVAAGFTKRWEQALLLVQPATLLRWHREMYRQWWTWQSKGRSNVSLTLTAESIALIRTMAAANRLWGAERIRGAAPQARR